MSLQTRVCSRGIAGDEYIFVSRTCDVMCAADHVVRFTRPSPSDFAYCKRSKTGAGEGLGMRLVFTSVESLCL